MATCTARGFITLGRKDRTTREWPVTGVADTDSADVSLEGGPWWPLEVGIDVVTGYFAGPDHPSPSPAHVVPVTSHAEIRISNGQISETFDGGFIQLVP
jgi:hypothetical protein